MQDKLSKRQRYDRMLNTNLHRLESARKTVFNIAVGLSDSNRPFDINFRTDIEELSEIKGLCDHYRRMSPHPKEKTLGELVDLAERVYQEASRTLDLMWRIKEERE
jgi:hypothetical protein